jgi:hypothetical protein
MMGKLAPIDTKIHRAIRLLANGALRHERVNALVALDSCSVKALEIELLTGLLKDKSGKVRALAADKIVGNGLLELEHELAVAASAEQNPGVAEELLACLEYLRHGFRAVQTGDLIWVSCRPARRGSVGQFFTEQEFKAKGAAWVAEVLNEA